VLEYFQDCPGLQIEMPENIDWQNEMGLQKQIAAIDVGIATLGDSEYHLAKSGIKAKQYMNSGVPVLSTNLPENSRFVKDGLNGFLCDLPEDYLKRLQQLKEMDDVEYNKICQAALASRADFDHARYWKAFLNLVQPTLQP
jgi:glycosyltransferase involved in cell wall biosynthesis